MIQHNIEAMNSMRMLKVTGTKQNKSTEKLSSGYKINRASDDAAGLSISEKMRRQVRGLNRASTNAQDGVSSVQTAEGALNEVHDMLQRMDELATQAANGTNSQTDREAIQNEIDQLTTEIDRVSETTKFNELSLLKGSDGTKQVTLPAHDAGLDGNLVDNGDGTASFSAELKAGEQMRIGSEVYTLKEDDGIVATDAAELAEHISDLKNEDKVLVEYGTRADGYEIAGNISQIDINEPAPQNYSFPRGNPFLNSEGNIASVTYTDENGQEQTFEMLYTKANDPNGRWEKIVSYNSRTGEAQTDGTPLYDTAVTPVEVADDGLKDVLRTATKMTITEPSRGDTMTFGSAEDIRKDVEAAAVGSKISMSQMPGAGPSGDFRAAIDPYQQLTKAEVVRETKDVLIGDDNTITIHDAKKLMAKELKQANSVGVDDPAAVTAQGRKSGSDIAGSMTISAPTAVVVNRTMAGGGLAPSNYTVEHSLKDAMGTDLSTVISKAGEAPILANPDTPTPGLTQADITAADGSVTTLVYERLDTTADPNVHIWKNAADDQVLEPVDVEELLSKAVSVDLNWNTARAAEEVDGVNGSSNPLFHYRTPDGMKMDISQLHAGDNVQVTDGEDLYGNPVRTGAVVVENDPAPGLMDFDLRLGSVETAEALSFNIHGGSDADLTNKIQVDIDTMDSKYLGIRGLDVVGKDEDGINIDDKGKAATYAIDAIEDAIEKVNAQRSSLGAIQNRLEHTINNVDNVAENTTAAESRIRDTDIAEEMVDYSATSVITQAGQSMLAQANQSKQGLLSLLGG